MSVIRERHERTICWWWHNLPRLPGHYALHQEPHHYCSWSGGIHCWRKRKKRLSSSLVSHSLRVFYQPKRNLSLILSPSPCVATNIALACQRIVKFYFPMTICHVMPANIYLFYNLKSPDQSSNPINLISSSVYT